MSAQIDALVDKLGQVDDTMKALADKQALLEDYKARRASYADLVATTKVEMDALVTASETQLRELKAAIAAVYP